MSKYSFSSGRPKRIIVPDFAGRKRTLPEEASFWQKMSNCDKPANLILLGLGPADPSALPFVREAEEAQLSVCWVESPEMLAYIKNRRLSSRWRQLAPEDFIKGHANSQIWFYKPGLAIAPDFWSPLLAGLEIASFSFNSAKDESFYAWLPGNDCQLLHNELVIALQKCGFKSVCQRLPEAPDISGLDKIWSGRTPDFILSVNFRGLDSGGKIFSLCRELKIPLAIWVVDNPWNLLSSIPLPWWKKASIFLTDPGFIDSLKKYGAQNVHFCPLAFAPHIWRPIPSHDNGKLLFVGRSAFPAKESFFKGIAIPPQIQEEAVEMFSRNQLPDYHWCDNKLTLEVWPGQGGRKIAYCADEFSALNRARWLAQAQKYNLEIIGDEGWHNLLPNTKILPPVDYYGTLPDYYGNAGYVLNITSLLLPQSLNQRHFDVWAAGGFLVSDNTQGLQIFPEELTAEIKIDDPGQLGGKIEWLNKNPERKRELQDAWREIISREHNYEKRVALMLDQAKVDLAN